MTEEEAKIVNCRKRKEFLDGLKHKRTRQGSFEESFYHLDHPLIGGGPMLEASDNGKSAGEIRASCEITPLWRKLWSRSRSKLTAKQRRILDALLVDYRTTQVARIAHVSTAAVKQFKKTFFKKHFSQCFQAWERDFAL